MILNDTIIALATASGAGAIAVIRILGTQAITLVSNHFKSVTNKKLNHYGLEVHRFLNLT